MLNFSRISSVRRIVTVTLTEEVSKAAENAEWSILVGRYVKELKHIRIHWRSPFALTSLISLT